MKMWIRNLIESAPTSPIDSFKWSDKRPIRKQIASGLLKAGGLIGGFAIILVVLMGQGLLADQHALSRASIVTYWAGLIAAAIIMIWTANRWAPFVTGFFFAPAAGKILGALVFGMDSYSRAISRTDLVVLLTYTLAVIALTIRFVGKRPAPTTALDRLALTFFVFETLNWVTRPRPSPPWPLLLGAFALFAAWCAHRWTGVNPTRKRGKDRQLIPS